MSKLDDILELEVDNDGEYYPAAGKSRVHDEQKRQVKELFAELMDEANDADLGYRWRNLRELIEKL